MRFQNLLRRAALACSFLAAGCAVGQPDFPLRRFTAGEVEAVRAFAATEVESGDAENLALVLAVQAQCELLEGDTESARRDFERAGQIMGGWSASSGEVYGAILGSESSKTYKGDPYEKAMCAFYLAYCYLQRGEPDNARAACKRGLLADAEIADEKFQVDNALLAWMAGRLSVLYGAQDADDFFREAVTSHDFALQHGAIGDPSPRVLTEPRAGNVVLFLECGMGPEKYADGIQNELAKFRPRPHPAAAARVSAGGQALGTGTVLLDVDYQARTMGGTAMEGIRQGKAVFKTAALIGGGVLLDQARRDRGDSQRTQAIVGGALLVAGLLTSTAADVRHWPTLPATVQVLTAQLPPGEHVLDVEFLDGAGRPLPSLRQQRRVVVPSQGETWQLFRSVPALSAPADAPAGPSAGPTGGPAR